MTKAELRDYLKAGYLMADAFDFRPGQDCEIFKVDEFKPGDEIIYIPDIYLNMVPTGVLVTDDEAIDDVVSNCYTGDDFIEECGGDHEKAELLFNLVDWQHPSSAHDDLMFDEEEEVDMNELHLYKTRELRPWTVRLCEAVYDITLNAQHMCETSRIEVEDSRELFASVFRWAQEFEEKHQGPWEIGDDGDIDYIDLIDEFAEKKLLETYGKEY